ncbi:PQQ-dependent dehydrogenase, methanol/ethanol family [Candidatus Sumerlaeota bacterium]|nr:PQQ-dependent dehydrogenase, methanol/ethanol family [Candidatus Sumerlaeota bacterium]
MQRSNLPTRLRKSLWIVLAIAAIGPFNSGWRAEAAEEGQKQGVTNEILLDSQNRPDLWVQYGRNYAGWRFAPMDEINRETVGRLKPVWTHETGVPDGAFEVTALVFGGKMYLTTPQSHLICVDPRTGEEIWRYDHELPDRVNLCCGPVNRGIAVLGNKIYYCTLEGHLLCFDADSGDILWEQTVGDYRDSYSLTLAPLVVKDKVIVGIAGAEYGVRGFIAAYDAETGSEAWRFYTIPGPGEPGSETWEGDSWMNGGGSAWVTGTYDPELNLIYWGIGNPSPDFNGDVRMGDNLYSNCIVALDADSGKLVWHYQASPHDVFDWDGVSEPILVDETINGVEVKALVQANRNGYLYALDRTNGKLLYASPYSKVDWALMDENGKPVLNPEIMQDSSVHVWPGLFGGKNWPPAAYSPLTHMIYIPDMERGSTFTSRDITFRRGLAYMGGSVGFDGASVSTGHIQALDVRTGEKKWSYDVGSPNWAGLLATGGGLVFGGAPDGFLRAFNDETGELLWKYQTGNGIAAPPTSFTIDGKQYIGIASGWRQRNSPVEIEGAHEGDHYILLGLEEE